MGIEERVKHPLEGEYIVFEYRECDYDYEGASLAVFQLKKGKLKTVYGPGNILNPEELEVESVYNPKTKTYITPTEFAITILKGRKVRDVATVVYQREPFFSIKFGCQEISPECNEDDELINWYEYSSISEESVLHYELTRNDINIRYFDNEKKEFIKD